MTERPKPTPDGPADEPDRLVIRDKRKIDPDTGAARPNTVSAAPAAETGQVPMVDAALLDERTADLQRLQAEYANYRRRAERERLAAGDVAVGRVLGELLPVLDDIDRARSHGDLTGGLKSITDQFELVLGKLGLIAFGEVGDPFDPTVHEAVLHNESDDVSVPTCTTVMRQGYRHGERLLRPAMVGVSEPTAPGPAVAGEVPAVEPVQPAATDSPPADTEFPE